MITAEQLNNMWKDAFSIPRHPLERLLKIKPVKHMSTDVKYFTPEIEDIRVGYECEISDSGITPIWTKYVVSHSALNNEKPTVIPSRAVDMLENYFPKRVRVPYLTKEQIEGEGWRYSKDNYDYWEFDKWELEFSYHTKTHMMEIWKGGQKPPMCLFYGEIKDINTFKYICKLLKIC